MFRRFSGCGPPPCGRRGKAKRLNIRRNSTYSADEDASGTRRYPFKRRDGFDAPVKRPQAGTASLFRQAPRDGAGVFRPHFFVSFYREKG